MPYFDPSTPLPPGFLEEIEKRAKLTPLMVRTDYQDIPSKIIKIPLKAASQHKEELAQLSWDGVTKYIEKPES